MALLELSHIRRNFSHQQVLKDINLKVEAGEFVAVMGESGAGKSTLLNIIATLIRADAGVITLDGCDLTRLSAAKAAKLRREKLGFVFQNYNLLDNFTCADNIYLPLILTKKKWVLIKISCKRYANS